ncbi:symporter small accessory protein [Desulfotomaculum sp. 1211_IL3151]
MLGFADPQIILAYILCILSAGLCVAYGIKNWNKDC